MTNPLIDVRSHRDFVSGHVPGAANIPREELSDRAHELPAQKIAVSVIDHDNQRALDAADYLQARGHIVTIVPFNSAALTETGDEYTRLWEPNEFLIEALAQLKRTTSDTRRAIDIACGSGRDAVYLAMQSYDVEAIDILPDALAKADDLARRCGVKLTTREVDLEREPQLPAEQYDIVMVFRYLQRSLFPMLAATVRPGGYIIYETFHERNLQANKKPRNPAHLLKSGELPLAFAEFDMLISHDGIERGGRFFSSLLARKPARAR
jgi:tellurite methyltransferase